MCTTETRSGGHPFTRGETASPMQTAAGTSTVDPSRSCDSRGSRAQCSAVWTQNKTAERQGDPMCPPPNNVNHPNPSPLFSRGPSSSVSLSMSTKFHSRTSSFVDPRTGYLIERTELPLQNAHDSSRHDPYPHKSKHAFVSAQTESEDEDSDVSDEPDEADSPVWASIARQADALAIHPDLRFLARYLLSLARIVRAFEGRLRRFPILVRIHRSCDVSPLVQAIFLVVVALAMVRRAMVSHARLVSNVLGALYPALQSVMAIEKPQMEDDEKLLTYWSVFGLFSVLDHASPQIQLIYPAYYTTKLSILFWIYARGGATKVYNTFYRPLLVKVSCWNVLSLSPICLR
ncbi:TB2/DP1, HVA22 family-domain-containing protein [Chytriomyces sp. MP71]|nr:TB2/DP1, HVA22 family-domain-containing protein [Chytriomyces sp. MP71]